MQKKKNRIVISKRYKRLRVLLAAETSLFLTCACFLAYIKVPGLVSEAVCAGNNDVKAAEIVVETEFAGYAESDPGGTEYAYSDYVVVLRDSGTYATMMNADTLGGG